MHKKLLNSAIYGLGLFVISFPLLLPVGTGVSAGVSEPPKVAVDREEALNSKVEALESKIDLLLNLLAKDGPFADTFRGPPGERGVEGPAGPVANSTEILARLEELEKFQGKMERDAVEKHSVIYFATWGGGIKVYSEETNKVETFVASTENLRGVAWDHKNQQLYYCSLSKIYRALRDGMVVETVFTSTSYGTMSGLAMDWISGNLYGVSRDGVVFVCKTTTTGPMNCTTVLTGQGSLVGITVDPNSGTMYWTRESPARVTSAHMDGTNVVQIVTGHVTPPFGIVIDYNSLRLFWVDIASNKVQSSKLDGTDVQTIVELTAGSLPWGIAIKNDRLFWGNRGSKSLQSSTKWGENVQTLYNGTHHIRHLTVATSNPAQTRPNHCEAQGCAGICVLNPHSFRCLP